MLRRKARTLRFESCEPRRMLAADCNFDSVIDNADLACVTDKKDLDAILANAELLRGDFDGNGDVGFSDFLTLSANFGTPVGSYTDGDVNLSGFVSFVDFLTLSQNFGATYSHSTSIPWAFVLCKTKDAEDPAWDANTFDDLVGADTPEQIGTINHYWREVSYNHLDLNDARVSTKWAETENDFDSYFGDTWMQACIDAAEPDVDFTDVTHVMFVLEPTSVRAGGGAIRRLTLEGEVRSVQIQHMYWEAWGHTTAWWAGPSRLPMLGTPLHEMGHSLGFPHIKLQGSPIDYSNPWDVMSNSSLTPVPFLESEVRMPQGTTVAMRDQAGWLKPTQRRFVETNEFQGEETLVLSSGSMAQDASKAILLEVSHAGDSYFFEARTQLGYDSQLPFSSVLVYARDAQTNRVQLLDSDMDDDATDDEATWLTGETFSIGDFRVEVTQQMGEDGFELTLSKSERIQR